jgi:hypothetical protein
MFRKAIFPLGGGILSRKVSVKGEKWHGTSVARKSEKRESGTRKTWKSLAWD